MNDILSGCECSLSSYYTKRWWGHLNLNCYNKICFEFFAFRGSEDAKTLLSYTLTPPNETFTT